MSKFECISILVIGRFELNVDIKCVLSDENSFSNNAKFLSYLGQLKKSLYDRIGRTSRLNIRL